MPSLLIPHGQLIYNGYQFDGAIAVKVNAEMAWDEAQRTIIYQRVKIEVEGTIQNDFGTDTDHLFLRRRLSQVGRELRFTGQGHGDIVVNVGVGGVRDVKWGPKPQVFSWEPIGAQNACKVSWEVVTCIPLCDYAEAFAGVMSINYEVSYAVSDRGYTSRTIAGYLELAMTRVGNTIPDNADAYRNLVNPTKPLAYKRTQTWNVNKAKDRIDFSITDSQIESPNAYPAGVVNIEVDHNIRWQRANRGAMTLRGSIEGSIEMAADQPPSTAWGWFLLIVQNRIAHTKARGFPVFLDGVRVTESLFGRKVRGSVEYRILACLSDLLKASGLWQPVGLNWADWETSMAPNVFHERGYSKLQNLPSNDTIIDLCGGLFNNLTEPQLVADTIYQDKDLGLSNDVPPPERSWLSYDVYVEPYRTRPVSRQSLLQSETPNVIVDPQDYTGFEFVAPIGDDDVLQVGGTDRYGVRIVGLGTRASWPIPRPSILQWEGQDIEETHTDFQQRIVGDYFGQPVYQAAFSTEYVAKNAPIGKVKPKANIEACFNADGQKAP